jgi:hypothetical protein
MVRISDLLFLLPRNAFFTFKMSYVFAEFLFKPARRVLHFADSHETHQPSTLLSMYLLHGVSCNRTYKQKMCTEIHLPPPS